MKNISVLLIVAGLTMSPMVYSQSTHHPVHQKAQRHSRFVIKPYRPTKKFIRKASKRDLKKSQHHVHAHPRIYHLAVSKKQVKLHPKVSHRKPILPVAKQSVTAVKAVNSLLQPITFPIKTESRVRPRSHRLDAVVPSRTEGWLVGLVGGTAVTLLPGRETFYLQPDVQKTYTTDASHTTQGVMGAMVGYEKMISSQWTSQFGIEWLTTNALTVNGSIWEDADPNFNNYSYRYQLSHSQAMVKGKLLYEKFRPVQAYLSGGVGVGWNQAKNFSIAPKIYEEIPAPSFTNESNSSLTYSVGLGLQKRFTSHFQAAFGYEFTGWGSARLGPAPGQTLSSGLGANSFNANLLQIGLFYVI